MASQLYTERKIQRRMWGLRTERPKAKPGQALVLVGSGGAVVLQPGQQATQGEAVWANYDTVYEVDMGDQELSFTTPAAAKGGDVYFQIAFSAGYRVSDPAAVVDRRIADPAPMLKRVIIETISRVTSGYDIEDGESAAMALRDTFQKQKLADSVPFVLDTIQVRVDLDAQAKDFLSKRREQRRAAELAQTSSSLTTAQAEAEKLKQQYDLAAQRRQQEHDLELKRLQTEAELKLQQMRLDVYKPMIQGGMWAVLVQQLAQNPGDISRVSELILQMHNQKVAADVQMLDALIKSDMIEDRHLKNVATTLVSSLEQSVRGGPLQFEAPQPQKQLVDKETAEPTTTSSE